MRKTRKDVALMAGVSEATVSFAMSGKRYVSEELKNRVMQAAKDVGYYPDLVARAMSEKRTNSIAVLTNDLTNPLQMKIIKSVEEAAMAEGFFVNVCGGSHNLDRYVENLIARHIDGVFLAGDPYAITGAHMNQLLDENISVILGTTRGITDARMCGIGIDFESGMRMILEYLQKIGHRSIAYLSAFDFEQQSDLRLGAFVRGMKELFGTENPVIKTGKPPYDSTARIGYEMTAALLEEGKSFTALVCTNDMMAFGAISALQQKQLHVPRDVSVVGIDDIILSKDYCPALTTLSHQTELFGQNVFKILLDNIRDKSVVQRKLLQPELILRESTASYNG